MAEQQTAELHELAEAGRWQELDGRLAERDDDEAWRLRGRLAVARGGPLDEALVAARRDLASKDDDDAASSRVLETIRLLHRHGATGAATGLAEAARERWPDREHLADEQVTTARPASDESHALGERRFTDTATALRARAEARPEADDAAQRRLEAALCAWAGGAPEAVEALRAVRDDTADAKDLDRRDVHRVASGVLSALEKDPQAAEEGPRWRYASIHDEALASGQPTIAALVLHGLGVSADVTAPAPTMAHLRLALERHHVVTRRVKADDETLDRALEQGAWVVLEEQRPADSGFPLVVGVEPRAGLLLLHDADAAGARLVDRESLRRRTRLFDDAALLIAGVGETGAERLRALDGAGVEEDPTAVAVDRCLVDEDGGVPPRARVAAMAEEALDAAPDAAMLWRVRGEALLESARLGRLQIGSGPFEAWYAEAHRRFPDSEWPFQLYAQALELTQRWEEAAIAWLDAGARDWEDPRNALGAARARLAFGDHRGAERAVRHALRLDPPNVEALARGALLASWRDAHELARVRSDLSIELAHDDDLARSVRVTVLERADRLDEATDFLGDAVGEDVSSGLGLRLCQRLAHRGDWDEAERLVRGRCEQMPGDPGNWALMTSILLARGDAREALGTAQAGMRLGGPSESLVYATVDVIAMMLDDDAGADAASGFARSLASSVPDALVDVSTRLARAGRLALALRVSDVALEVMPGRADVPWRRAQALLCQPSLPAEGRRTAGELLDQTVGLADHFGPARVLRGWLALDDDPERAVELASHPTASEVPALSWPLLVTALEATGARDEAAAVRERVAALDPEALGSGLGLLHTNRLLGAASGLLASLEEAHPDAPLIAMYRAMAIDATGDSRDALGRLSAIEERSEGFVPDDVLHGVAARAGDWEALGRFAERTLRLRRRVSGPGWQDAWAEAGRRAGAEAARGDDAARTQLLEVAKRHPAALWALASVTGRAGTATADEDAARLAEVAPGAYAAMKQGVEP